MSLGVNLILSADLNLGKYSSSTHMDYMRLSQSYWTQMLAVVSQMSSSTEHQFVKSLASLAYEVRHSTSSGQCSNTLLGEDVVTS